MLNIINKEKFKDLGVYNDQKEIDPIVKLIKKNCEKHGSAIEKYTKDLSVYSKNECKDFLELDVINKEKGIISHQIINLLFNDLVQKKELSKSKPNQENELDKIDQLISENYMKYKNTLDLYIEEYIKITRLKEINIDNSERLTIILLNRNHKAQEIISLLLDGLNNFNAFYKYTDFNDNIDFTIFLSNELNDEYYEYVGEYNKDIYFGAHYSFTYDIFNNKICNDNTVELNDLKEIDITDVDLPF